MREIGIGIFAGLVIIAAIVLVAAGCNYYTINFWLDYAGKDTAFPLWACCVIACVPGIGQLSIPVAIVTFIISLFL